MGGLLTGKREAETFVRTTPLLITRHHPLRYQNNKCWTHISYKIHLKHISSNSTDVNVELTGQWTHKSGHLPRHFVFLSATFLSCAIDISTILHTRDVFPFVVDRSVVLLHSILCKWPQMLCKSLCRKILVRHYFRFRIRITYLSHSFMDNFEHLGKV